MEVESEEEVDTDEKDSYILHSEVEKVVKGLRGKKAVGDDDVPENVLKLLGECGLRTMTQRILNIYEPGCDPGMSVKLQFFPSRRSQRLQNAATIPKSASSQIQDK